MGTGQNKGGSTMWTISGDPCNGYRLVNPDGENSVWHFSKMWDAIEMRDAINRGEIKPGGAR